MRKLPVFLLVILLALTVCGFDPAFAGKLAPANLLCSGSDLNCGLVGYWRGDGASPFRDFSGYGHNGTAQNGAITNTGQIGDAFELIRASSQYVHVADSDLLDLTTAGTIAVMAYTASEFPSADGTTRFWGLLTKSAGAGATQQSYVLSWNGTNATHFIRAQIGDAIGIESISSNSTFNGAWHFIVFRWDGSFLYLRVDATDITPVAQTITPQNLAQGLCIGRAFNGDAFTFDGLVDEAAVWNRALTDQEVSEYYNAVSAGMYHPFFRGKNTFY